MTLTDGKTTVEISKYEMEILLDELHNVRYHEEMNGVAGNDSVLVGLIGKLESLDF